MLNRALIVAQYSQPESQPGPGEIVVLLIYLAIVILMIVSLWKVFEKANQPGWGILIPIYNLILMLRVAGKPIWWILLMLIPLVNIIPSVLVPIAIAKNFGKSAMFGVGLIFLPFIFYPILGLGDAEYNPPVLFNPTAPPTA